MKSFFYMNNPEHLVKIDGSKVTITKDSENLLCTITKETVSVYHLSNWSLVGKETKISIKKKDLKIAV